MTQSVLGDFVDCRRRCRWNLDGWRKRETKDSLEYGSLFHNLLENLYKNVRNGSVGITNDACVDSDWWRDTLQTWRGKLAPTADGAATQQTEFCIAQATGVWNGYLVAYPKDFERDRWMELEATFDVKWNGYRLRGRRDGMLTIRRKPWLFETKTKSQISAGTIEATLSFDFQSLFYLTANQAEMKASGRKGRIQGVLYNIVRRPQHKLAKGETLVAHSGRIAADVAKRPDHWFVRYEAAYPPEAVAQHQEQLLQKLLEFERWLRGDLPTYRNESACIKRWHCSCIPLCAGDETAHHRDGRLFEELED